MLQVALLGSTWVLYLLFALSVISIAAMAERWWFFRRHRDDAEALRKGVAAALLDGDVDQTIVILGKSRSIEARVVREALAWRKGGAGAVSDAVESELGRVRKDLERGSSMLGTLGNNAPFIGLFGTVLGVIEAFHHLGAGASKTAMGNVMSGIAEALVATGVGLFVALPAVIAYNIIQKRIGEIESSTTALSKLVTAYVQTSDRAAAVSPEASRVIAPADVATAEPRGGVPRLAALTD
jgi:biopolymer transport protein ExbB/biopolymer transport protein TolQ